MQVVPCRGEGGDNVLVYPQAAQVRLLEEAGPEEGKHIRLSHIVRLSKHADGSRTLLQGVEQAKGTGEGDDGGDEAVLLQHKLHSIWMGRGMPLD